MAGIARLLKTLPSRRSFATIPSFSPQKIEKFKIALNINLLSCTESQCKTQLDSVLQSLPTLSRNNFFRSIETFVPIIDRYCFLHMFYGPVAAKSLFSRVDGALICVQTSVGIVFVTGPNAETDQVFRYLCASEAFPQAFSDNVKYANVSLNPGAVYYSRVEFLQTLIDITCKFVDASIPQRELLISSLSLPWNNAPTLEPELLVSSLSRIQGFFLSVIFPDWKNYMGRLFSNTHPGPVTARMKAVVYGWNALSEFVMSGGMTDVKISRVPVTVFNIRKFITVVHVAESGGAYPLMPFDLPWEFLPSLQLPFLPPKPTSSSEDAELTPLGAGACAGIIAMSATYPMDQAITTSGTKKELFLADLNTQLKNRNFTTDLKVDTESNLFTTVTVYQPHPGLKTIVSFVVPDQRSGKLELQYLHDYAGITACIGLNANPVANFSGVLGNNMASIGADVSFDSKTGNFTKCNAGFGFANADLTGSLTLNDKGDTLSASYYHTVTNTAVGAELTHNFSSNENSIGMGTQHALDPLTTVKAHINNNGKTNALIQQQWRPKSLLTLSGEFDPKAVDKTPKFGLALALES